ncbi:purine and uridine phosphorylase, partial [Cryphonectria parasitica EP155]
DFTVGLVYVKPLEMRALTMMLDERYRSEIPTAHGDDNEYILGRIGDHNVVVVGPPRGEQGTVATAQTVPNIRLTFPNVTIGLLVGIGGGIPHYPEHDVRLGDVVVGAPESGPAVVQYDFGKRTADEGFEVTRTLAKPPRLLLSVVNKVEDKYGYLRTGDEDVLKVHLSRFLEYPNLKKQFYDRPQVPDRLFLAPFTHQPGTVCAEHESDMEVARKTRETGDHIVVHYSTILSGDTLMKSPGARDALSRKHNNALCFDMEAAGLMDVFPCLVICGISDYADSHKNDAWQKFAAAAAAAYAREILLNMA